eukprot:139129_1
MSTIPSATQSANNALYWEGTAPLIIFVQLDGDLSLNLPDRKDGCVASGSTACIWNSTHCPNSTTRSSSSCRAYTSNWAYTKEIAQRLYEIIDIKNAQNESLGKPHLIMNNLKRIKLDSDREINEATQGNSIATQTWNQIHNTFTNTTINKIKTDKNCGFGGLVIDITGHSYTEDIHFRYKLFKTNINSVSTLNTKLTSTSIKTLIEGKTNQNVTSAILGSKSLSQLFSNEDTQSLSILPTPSTSPTQQITTTYISGNTATLQLHGSQNSESETSAIQIALKSTIRSDATKREAFCQDFSHAIIEYMKYWYSNQMASCNTITPSIPTDNPTDAPTVSPTFSPTYPSSSNYQMGEHNYTGYIPGNGPLIILSQHGGSLEKNNDTNIGDRDNGCVLSACQSNCDCVTWPGKDSNCPANQQKSSNYCAAKTLADGKTQEIATCVYNAIINGNLFNHGNTVFKPHLVLSNLHRSKLDPNREIFEAAQGNAKSIKAWKEINLKWVPQAAQRNKDRCDFGGLVLDIHGQAKNNYSHIGYKLGWKSSSNYVINDSILTDNHLNGISIKSLIEGKDGATITDAVRGIKSFQYYLDQELAGTVNDFDTIPLRDGTFMAPSPTSSNFYYYAGGHSLSLFGSQNSSSITDAIQIEIPGQIRWNTGSADRDIFCNSLANAITNYVEEWYDLSKCNYGGKHSVALEEDNKGHGEINNDNFIKQIIVFSISALLFITVVVIGILLIRKYKLKKEISKQSKKEIKQPLTPVEVVEIPNISAKMESVHNVQSDIGPPKFSQQTIDTQDSK